MRHLAIAVLMLGCSSTPAPAADSGVAPTDASRPPPDPCARHVCPGAGAAECDCWTQCAWDEIAECDCTWCAVSGCGKRGIPLAAMCG